jgi:hypothetical protein
MSKLKLQDLKIFFPNDFKGEFSEADIVEWLECQIGIRYKHDISNDNPLFALELSDCTVSVEKATLDNKEIEIDKIV